MGESNKNSGESLLQNFRLCRGCLASNRNVKSLYDIDLNENFSWISNIQINVDSFPGWLCWQCVHFIRKIVSFRDVCHKSAAILSKYNLYKNPQNTEIIKKEIGNSKDFLSKSNIVITDYPSTSNSSEQDDLDKDIKYSSSLNNSHINESKIKEESKTNFGSWDGEEIESNSILNDNFMEVHDDQFNDSDDEPVMKIIKFKKIKIKSKQRKRNKIKQNKENLPNKNKISRTDNLKNTPAKNFDMSMVIVSSLTVEQQLHEMENIRTSNEYSTAPYKCRSCAKWFVHEIVYKEHVVKHDIVSGQYKCELCYQRFNSRRNLTNHQETHAFRYSCKICGKVVISKQNIMSHMYTEHDQTNKQITCDICHRTYKNRYTYTKHMRIHNNSKEYKCHLCPKVFLWKDNLNRHLTRHKTERPFVCDQCSKSFYSKENLKDHILVHSGAKRFYCVECDLCYASQAKLNQHLKRGTRHLTPEQLTFSCSMCDVRYTNSQQLSMHVDRVHLNKRSHVCQQCDAAFVSKKTLLTHVKIIHEGYKKPRDHICETCGKGFSDKQVLKAHIRTHTGEKPFCCKHCGVKFAHSGAMYTHIRLVHLKLKRNYDKRKRKSATKTAIAAETNNLTSTTTKDNVDEIIPIPIQESIDVSLSHALTIPFNNNNLDSSCGELS